MWSDASRLETPSSKEMNNLISATVSSSESRNKATRLLFLEKRGAGRNAQAPKPYEMRVDFIQDPRRFPCVLL